MPKLRSIEGFMNLREESRLAADSEKTGARIIVGMGTCGIAAGARDTYQAIAAEVRGRGVDARLFGVGCIGMCSREPLVDIDREGAGRITYGSVRPDMVPRLIEEHLIGGRVVREWAVGRLPAETSPPRTPPLDHAAVPPYAELPFYRKQQRIALRNCGRIDPENIREAIAQEGYTALARVLKEMSPRRVLAEMKASGLRGRGGAGFPTGLKWEFTSLSKGEPKYVVCNADEGDPGAFMDRSIIEGDPHSLVEGMTIAAYAIGAAHGYVYCRAEYPLALKRLHTAIAQAHDLGLLGEEILGTGFSFELEVKEGAGAFVCGEETALLASIEGRRGEPRPRPPFPAVAGLWGKPTTLNNVKSYALTPRIILNGAEWFAGIGSPKSPGTAIFALTGKVRHTGLVEVPMGIPLGEIIFDIGGGITGGRRFKAVQTGGPLGGCIPPAHLNVRVDFDSLRDVGAVMGSGGMIVVDEDTCMVEFAKFFLTFATAESCGKCIPCRAGGRRMLEVLSRICAGEGRREDLERIRAIAAGMETASLCALGQLTPGPVMAALRYFEHEFIVHIDERRCPAGACKELTPARCMNACPAGVDVPAYVSLAAEGRYAEALAVHRERNPFALVCGRVCPAFCEQHCRRGDIDAPVAIRSVKRFMADHELAAPWMPVKAQPARTEPVAIIGSGPAGLTAALRLSQMGYPTTIFEALPVPGGMMAVGIPEYRLPREILQKEIDHVRRAGADIICNRALGRDFTLEEIFETQGFRAAILAIGAHRSLRLGIPGEDGPNVMPGIHFLRHVALGTAPAVAGRRVAVIGGGNAAVDAARTAWRLGAAEVHLVYRRTRPDMPAYPEEIEAAREEGVVFHFLAAPIRILPTAEVEIQYQALAEFDAGGRRRPVPVPEALERLAVDVVIPAIGQEPDKLCLLNSGLETRRDSTLKVGPSLTTSRPGVFAAGDAVSGPASVIEAVAHGNRVAREVDSYLRTGKPAAARAALEAHLPPLTWDMAQYGDAPRLRPLTLPVSGRTHNFHEVEQTAAEADVRTECRRCLRCDLEWGLLQRGQTQPEALEAAASRV
ncbi:MAG: FAD-dependent oxidoreductase [Desulfobacterales bacterium]